MKHVGKHSSGISKSSDLLSSRFRRSVIVDAYASREMPRR